MALKSLKEFLSPFHPQVLNVLELKICVWDDSQLLPISSLISVKVTELVFFVFFPGLLVVHGNLN